MKPIILLIILYIAEILLSPKRNERYRNTDALLAAAVVTLLETVCDILIAVLSAGGIGTQWFYLVVIIQAVAILGVKLYSKKKDSYTKYGIPPKYNEGWRAGLIHQFYDAERNTPVIYIKGATVGIGFVSYVCAVILAGVFVFQSYLYTAGNTLELPFAAGGLVSLLVEFGIFCSGGSLWSKLYNQYKRKIGCRNRRSLASAKYAGSDNYEFPFRRNHVMEGDHITRSTKFHWKDKGEKTPITYYDFSEKSTNIYDTPEHNPKLEGFIKENALEPNELYVAAYNLIDRNENVLIKTPSYVDFEPYLTALIKMKVAKTQKIVLVVSNEEKKLTTIQKLKSAFAEYFGFENIPVISTIDEYDCIRRDQKKAREEAITGSDHLAHLVAMADEAREKAEVSFAPPVKEADVIIAAPEDICDTQYVGAIRSVLRNIGLIVYYDFSDCVQEEALFSRIVHSVLDCDDNVSTLYMSDAFFDLDQVLDNFFSKRNLYKIVVPRKPSQTSYVTGWKAENMSEMQTRTVPDASRNIGNHVPILYDSYHLENDFMVVEDEFDAYSENYSNLTHESIAKRLDCHVGWTDVIGGRNVFCTVSDTYNNVAHTYLAMRGIGSESEYINIVSRPYMLRKYLMYNLRYFAEHPGVLSSYSPGSIKTPKALAYEALVKTHIAGCTIEQLSKYIADTKLKAENTPEAMINALASLAYGEDMAGVNVTSDIHDRYYVDEETYRRIIDRSGFVEKIEFVNNNKIIKRNKREYCYIIPQQKIVLDGIKYTVESIEGNRVQLTDSNVREPMFMTRSVRSCEVTVKECEAYGNLYQQRGESSLTFRRLIGDAKLDVFGNIVFKDSYHPLSDVNGFDYQELPERRTKEYKDINIFNVRLTSCMINSENRGELARMLALILNEMLPTFFPRHFRRILVGCNDWEATENIPKEDISAFNIVSRMSISDEEVKQNEISLYIMEDSALETGLVNVFWQDEEFRYMLKILEDYLYFQEKVHREEREDMFGDANRDILHTLRKVLLHAINEKNDTVSKDKIYFNSIRRSRTKFNFYDIINVCDITCDFCGKKISIVPGVTNQYQFYSYSGMISCMPCFNKAVCSQKHDQDDIDLFAEKINAWFAEKYNDSVTNKFYNHLEDVEILENRFEYPNGLIITDDYNPDCIAGLSYTANPYDKRFGTIANPEGIHIGPSEWQSEGVLPEFEDYRRASYMVFDRNLSYILIRDGLEYKIYMGVLCHEMTHQWQHTNLDDALLRLGAPSGGVDEFGKRIDLSNFRVEGHATWEEIRYMKAHGAFAEGARVAAARKNSNDVYGVGYRWMCRMMRLGGDDPLIPVIRSFGFIMKRTWYQITNNSFGIMRLYFGKENDEEKQDKNTADESVTDENNPVESADVAEDKPTDSQDVPESKGEVPAEEAPKEDTPSTDETKEVLEVKELPSAWEEEINKIE